MVNLEQLYEKIDTKLSDNRPKEDKLHQRAQERLSVFLRIPASTRGYIRDIKPLA